MILWGVLPLLSGAVASARICDFNLSRKRRGLYRRWRRGRGGRFHPWCVTVDALGNLYISDWFNNVVRKVTVSGAISTVAGNGTLGYSGDGGPATSAQLAYPCAVAVDPSGNVYIADSANNVIRKVTAAGNISTIAGNDSRGYTGDFGQATAAQLYEPTGLALDAAGNLYVADSGNPT